MRLRTRNLPVFPLSPDPIRSDVDPDVEAVDHEIGLTGPYHGPRIGLVTLGCDKNTVDSERMMAALVGHGAQVSSDVDGAEVIIVNTCGFISAAKEQSIEAILEACAYKESGRTQAVVAVGCMVQRYKDELSEHIPEVDLFLGLTDMERLVPELRERGMLPRIDDLVPNMERPLRVLSSETRHTSYLKISEGCDHSCAFCAIPHMRGLHRSAPVEELVREAQQLAARGVKELNIVSQDTTWYGRDLKRKPGGTTAPLLPDLMKALLEQTEVPWYRLFYMYPSGITRETVELLASTPRIVPYLDMPIQHGSDRILTVMRRPERQATIRERVSWLRSAVPGLTLRTTVIVGFPGETDEDFRQMIELLQEVRFERVGAFAYSPEEGTPAAEMPDQVSDALKRERLEELMEVQRSISFDSNLDLVGERTTVLVDRIVEDDPEFVAAGRTVGQALDVDGETQITGPAGIRPGQMLDVEIVDALDYDLVAAGLDPPEG